MKYKCIEFEEYAKKVDDIEAAIQEPEDVFNKIHDISMMLYDMLPEIIRNNKKIVIFTDYDADGICAAYILLKLLKAIDPNIEVSVICNDRRNPYGVPKNIPREENAQYIVLDMGCSDLQDLKTRYGSDIIIIDHHLITDENTRKEFIESNRLIDLHALSPNGKGSEYCAAALTYRIFQTISEEKELIIDEKERNAIAIMAGIATIADCMSLADTKSYNRFIVRDAMDKINNADEENLSFAIGYFLAQCGIGLEDCTAEELAFNIASTLNAPGRISEELGYNGAQEVFDTLIGPDTYETCNRIDNLIEINKRRKEIVENLQRSNDYQSLISGELQKPDTNICVYLLPQEVATGLCGVLAGRIASSTGKAAVVLTYHAASNNWSGSARNAEGLSELHDFFTTISQKEEARSLDMSFGGHPNAVGISKLNDGLKFVQLVNKYQDLLRSDPKELEILKVDLTNLDEMLPKLESVEPIGKGCELPPVLVQGLKTSQTKFLGGGATKLPNGETVYKEKNPNHAKQKIKVGEFKNEKTGRKNSVYVEVSDFGYNAGKYLVSAQDQIAFLANLGISNYGGTRHIELKAADYNREFAKDWEKQVQSINETTEKVPKKVKKTASKETK